MIQAVIRYQDKGVRVFDKRGVQILKYQGQYEKVKKRVLRDAPAGAKFYHESLDGILDAAPREKW